MRGKHISYDKHWCGEVILDVSGGSTLTSVLVNEDQVIERLLRMDSEGSVVKA